MKKKTTFLAMAVTAIAFALAGCHSNKEESEILRPISENFVGRWKLIDNYLLDENGNRVEDESDDNVSEMIVTFRPDGKAFQIATSTDGWQQIQDAVWRVDEEKSGYYLKRSKEYFFSVHKLTADRLLIGVDAAQNMATGEVAEGRFRFEYQRVPDEQSLSERLLGKWVSLKAYKKVDGEWQEAPNCRPQEGWYHYHSTGLVNGYQRFGDKEQAIEMQWSANVETNRMHVVKGEWSDEWHFSLTDADTMEIYDDEDIDFTTGERISGEFKDVMVREK